MAKHKETQCSTQSDRTYTRWDFSATIWSGARPYEDTIKVLRYAQPGEVVEWYAATKCDQNTVRDLTNEEIAHLRSEVELVFWNGESAP